MSKRYTIVLLVSGLAWFLVAGVLGSAIPVFGDMWAQHLACAILTALAVGLVFRGPVLRWSGWRWYALPILTLLAATSIFGLLLPFSWFVTGVFSGGGVDAEAFYKTPLALVFYGMTFCLVVLYPLALATQYLLRRACGAEPTAGGDGDLART